MPGIKDRPRRLRSLLARDGDSCCYCGTTFSDTIPPTIEHIIPRSQGGPNALTNLKLACRDCNNARGDRSIAHWHFRRTPA